MTRKTCKFDLMLEVIVLGATDRRKAGHREGCQEGMALCKFDRIVLNEQVKQVREGSLGELMKGPERSASAKVLRPELHGVSADCKEPSLAEQSA